MPQHLLSRLAGKICDLKKPIKFKNWLINLAIRHYKIDMSIARSQNLDDYPTFNAFFTRYLKSDARPMAVGDNLIVSPVDGAISQIAAIHDTKLIQAKGINYSLWRLLAGESELVTTFKNGMFTTIYLSPRDYHRIHMPITGTLEKVIYVSGHLFSVNPLTVDSVPDLFARNERLITIFQTTVGKMALIFVGATLVAGIHTVFQGAVTPCKKRKIQTWDYTDKNLVFKKGQELGHFQFGSTVILLFPQNTIDWSNHLHETSPVQLGQMLAKVRN
jgi:phosphatidylserine decarboxylase